MNNLMIYNKALSEKDIQRIYFEGKNKWYHKLLRWVKNQLK